MGRFRIAHLIICLVFVLVMVASCSVPTAKPTLPSTPTPSSTPTPTPTPTTIPIPTLSLTYESSAYGVKIKYPQDWTKQEGATGTVVEFFAPKESASATQAALAITVQDLSAQSLSLDAYTQRITSQLRQTITDFNLIESSATTLAGSPAHKVVYTGKQGQRNPKVFRVWTIVNNKGYIITYAANPNNYSDFLGIIQQMIDSFSISTPPPTPTPTPATTPTPTPTPTPSSKPWPQAKFEPADGQSYFGFVFKTWDLTPASANAPYGDIRPFSERIKDAVALELGGKSPTVIKVQTDWQTSDRSFLPFSDALEQINRVRAAVGSNVVPFLEWQSVTGPSDTNTTQPYNGITTKDVVSGSLDSYIRQFARDIKKWGEPLFIRPISGEFNYVYWKWSAPLANPQLTAADFVNAWRHTVDIFRQEGVTNVAWVWTPYPPPPNPSISWKGDRNFESYYPGDDYVDWAGADSYVAPNWFDSLYNFAVAHQKPFFVAEWGARAPGSKLTHDQQNAWFEEMFDYFESHIKIKAILYFNYNWGNVSELTSLLTAADHVWLYDGQVNYQPNVNIGDSRLIAGGKDQRELFARRIKDQRYTSTLVTASGNPGP